MLYPYAISRESVNGHRVWIAKSLHLKGCVAQGDTRLEAIKELESNEIAWLETAMAKGFYEGVNLSLAYCDDCGHEELSMDVCPKCGSRNLTKIVRMNGYLSYSRVKGDTRLNDAKMAEIAERKSM